MLVHITYLRTYQIKKTLRCKNNKYIEKIIYMYISKFHSCYSILSQEYHFQLRDSCFKYFLPISLDPSQGFFSRDLGETLRSRINHTNSPRTLKVTRLTEVSFHEESPSMVRKYVEIFRSQLRVDIRNRTSRAQR